MAGSERLVMRAAGLIESDPDEAHRIINGCLNDDPDDPKALYIGARLYIAAGRFGVALQMLRRVTQLVPQRDAAWNDFGMCLSSIQRFREARDAFLEATKRGKDAGYTANVAMTYLEEGDFKLALRWAEKALAMDADQKGAQQTAGFAHLAMGEWAKGWRGYNVALGGKFRKIIRVDDEPQWDGKRVDTLFVYGEQGLGDEIMMASCVPDAARDVGKVVLECDPRLAGLFKRSFPNVDVYGTRRIANVEWPQNYAIDAGAAIGQLPMFYRPTPESCPGTPYLVADPERRLQWRALLDSLGRKPKIGICWSGGKKWTNSTGRNMGLEAFRPLIESIDADWISLQYKDPQAEIAATGLPVRHWPHGSTTSDYDDTAALVSELDMVIGVHTAVHHLAGALGVPATVLVPSKGLWIWAQETQPFYRSARIFRQRDGEEWQRTVRRLSVDDQLLDRLGRKGSGGVARSSAVDHRTHDGAGGDQAAHVEVAELVSEPS